MKKLLQVDFNHAGPFGDAMASALKELAASINEEPGMIWKIWTENTEAGEAGGVYLFESEENAESYLKMHTARLQAMGINEVRGKIFDVNFLLTAINQGPVI